MDEMEFTHYLNAYIQASTGQPIDFPDTMRFVPNVRGRAALAVAVHDASTGRAARAPSEVAEEVERIVVGVKPAPATAT